MLLGCNVTQVISFNQSYNSTMVTWHLDSHEVFQIILVAVVFLMSVCGNVAVVVVVFHCAALRSTVNYFLVNLAVADFMFTIFCWPTIANKITFPIYVLGRTVCKMNILVEVTSVTVSVLTLAAVACDRVYAVMMPIRARNATAFPFFTIISIWLVSLAVAFPSFYMRDVQAVEWLDFRLEVCTDLDHHCTKSARIGMWYYRVMLALILFFVPGIVMVLAYTVIGWRLWCVRTSLTEGHDHKPPAHIRARRKVVMMTAAVVATFLLCWSPLYTIVLYNLTHTSDMTGDQMPPWVEQVLFWVYFLGYFNSALNPLLYGGFSDNFRQGFRTVYRSFCSKYGRGGEQYQNSASLPLYQGERQTLSGRMSSSLSGSKRKASRQTSLLKECNVVAAGSGINRNGVC